MPPEEPFIPEPDYPEYYAKLNGLRGRAVASLPLEPRIRVLDVATGSAFFAIELAGRDPSLKIVGIDISDRAVRSADRNVWERWLDSSVSIMKMDATRLEFQASSFGLATSFLGLGDVHMTPRALSSAPT